MPARVLLFALDDLRRRYGHLVPAGADPRVDTTPFRAFRDALLEAARRGASEPCDLSFWWEGTFNGYALAVGVRPPEALSRLDVSGICPLEDERVAPPPPARWAMAVVIPGHAELASGEDGAVDEAPFGEATGHFGAPGVRRVR